MELGSNDSGGAKNNEIPLRHASPRFATTTTAVNIRRHLKPFSLGQPNSCQEHGTRRQCERGRNSRGDPDYAKHKSADDPSFNLTLPGDQSAPQK
jgi:hypothetical protein